MTPLELIWNEATRKELCMAIQKEVDLFYKHAQQNPTVELVKSKLNQEILELYFHSEYLGLEFRRISCSLQ